MLNDQSFRDSESLSVYRSPNFLHILLGILAGVLITSTITWYILIEIEKSFFTSSTNEALILNQEDEAVTQQATILRDSTFSTYEIRSLKAAVEGERAVYSLWNQEQIIIDDLNALLSPFYQANGNNLSVEIFSRDATAEQIYLLMIEQNGPGSIRKIARLDLLTKTVSLLPNISPLIVESEYQVLEDNVHVLSWGATNGINKIFISNLKTDESKLFYTTPTNMSLVSTLKNMGRDYYTYEFDVSLVGDYLKIGLYDTTKSDTGQTINISDNMDLSWIVDNNDEISDYYPLFVKHITLPLAGTY